MHKGCWSRSGVANSFRVRLLLLAISICSGWSGESDEGIEGASRLGSDEKFKSRRVIIGCEVEVLTSP